jgi:hypothetical protein
VKFEDQASQSKENFISKASMKQMLKTEFSPEKLE